MPVLTPSTVLVAVLLALGVVVQLWCCLGLLLARASFDRLHYLGPATLLGFGFVAAAVLVDQGLSPAGIRAVIISGTLLITGPMVAHVTGRALRLREFGNGRPAPLEPAEPGQS